MTDIVEQQRDLQSGAQWACGETAATLGQAADDIERLREVLRRALNLHDIEQAERPTPNVPAWVEDARTLLTEGGR